MSADHSDPFEYINLLDLNAIEDEANKVAECEYFLALAERETEHQRFRWLISAFFGAAYSYFEMAALKAHIGFTAPDTGEPVADSDAIAILRNYVVVLQDRKNPSYVKTAGKHPITKKLFELRRGNTHHFPLSIMATGPSLPEDFQFGRMKDDGTPALPFCRTAMRLILAIQAELRA